MILCSERKRRVFFEPQFLFYPRNTQQKATHGDYRLEEVYFATSHARVGATFPVGCITVDGRMCISINPPWPLVGEKESGDFADAFVELLTVVASEQDGDVVEAVVKPGI